MKKLLALFAIGILFFACSENTNLVDPVDQHNSTLTTQSPQPTLNWLSTPSTKTGKFVGLDQVAGVKMIDLSVGGDVKVNFVSADRKKTISATLHVPAGALKDRRYLVFYMLIDNEKLSIKFLPHPATFDIPLKLDLEYTGLDLRGIDPGKIYFAYLDDPTTGFIISNKYIYTDVRTGTLRITGGEIPHFSEYGFVR
ncbi:MAG: hypothetical protein ACYC4T_11465 [Melioribacteraceae bacterium]